MALKAAFLLFCLYVSGFQMLRLKIDGATITVALQLISPDSLPLVNNQLCYPQPS
jgi:hypothetical protein